MAVAVCTADGEVHGEVYGLAGFVDGDGLAGDWAGDAEWSVVAAWW